MDATWLATEHSRIHLIEEWPEGPRKEAALASARSTLDSLLRSSRANGSTFACVVCGARSSDLAIIEYPKPHQDHAALELVA